MAANEILTNRIREVLAHLPRLEEKKMFMGICFMVDDKMCVCSGPHEMLCRIGPDTMEMALEMNGVRAMEFNGRTSKGYVFVSMDNLDSKKEFDYWIGVSLDFNKIAVPTKKRKSKKA